MSAALAHDPTFDPASAPARDPSTPAGGATLGVPERTVRTWLASIRDELHDELATERAAELLRAVESLRQLCVTAWDAYDRSTRRDDDILAGKHDVLSSRRILRAPSHAMKSAESATSASLSPHPRTTALPSSESTTADAAATGLPGAHSFVGPAAHAHILAETYTRPRLANQAPALLRIVLSAQVEIAKLLDLPALARAQSLAAATTSPADPFPTGDEELVPAESATRSPTDPDPLLWYERDDPAIPAESARSATLAPAANPAPSPDPSPDPDAPVPPTTIPAPPAPSLAGKGEAG